MWLCNCGSQAGRWRRFKAKHSSNNCHWLFLCSNSILSNRPGTQSQEMPASKALWSLKSDVARSKFVNITHGISTISLFCHLPIKGDDAIVSDHYWSRMITHRFTLVPISMTMHFIGTSFDNFLLFMKVMHCTDEVQIGRNSAPCNMKVLKIFGYDK